MLVSGNLISFEAMSKLAACSFRFFLQRAVCKNGGARVITGVEGAVDSI